MAGNSGVWTERGADKYRAAVAADEAFTAALVAAYGKGRARDMRYATKHTDPAVLAAIKNKHEADAAWLAEAAK